VKRLALVFLGATLGGCPEPPRGTFPARHAGLNLLLITVDTLRADHLGCYDYLRATSPSIDGLAARGVAFDNAYTYWPKTRGSFASLFTSRYASEHGLNVRDRDLPEFNLTLAEHLKARGYHTAAALDNGNLDRRLGFAQGFDEYEQAWLSGKTEIERTEALTRFGVDFLKRKAEAPFFLWLHYVNPHTPYEPPTSDLARFRADGKIPRGPVLPPVVGFHGGVNRFLTIENENHLGDYVDRYDAEIAFADREIGKVLEALDESSYRGTTLVVFTSDHGESLGEHDYYFDHGSDLFEPSLRVPLVFSLPGALPEGARVSAPVTNLDVFPTVLDLFQISFPPELQGRSVLPLTRGEDRLHDWIAFQNDQHQMAFMSGRLKLIANPSTETELGSYELYDLARDPGETRDRYARSARAVGPLVALLGSFKTRTVAWQQETTRKRQGKAAFTDDQLSPETLQNLETLGYLGRTKPRGKK